MNKNDEIRLAPGLLGASSFELPDEGPRPSTEPQPAATNLDLAQLAAELRRMDYIFFYDRVAVKTDEAVKKIGKIFLPDGAEERRWTGTVVGLGLGEQVLKSGVRITDRVAFNRWNPTVVELVRENGDKIMLTMYHVTDLYVGWRDDEAFAAYEAACVS